VELGVWCFLEGAYDKIPLWGGVARSDGVVTRLQATNRNGGRKL